MTNGQANKPSKAECRKLLEQVDRLVLAQTNVFIRKLLRDIGKKPGANKAEFRKSLEEAICDDGTLTKELLDTWLRRVEGWGNQHVYAFGVPDDMADATVWNSEASVKKVAAAAFTNTWRAPISDKFPPSPQLTRIDYSPDPGLFVVEWHERTDAWVRELGSDIKRPKGGDAYWYKAFREEPSRRVMRFALRLRRQTGARPLAALFLREPVRSKEHGNSLDIAWRDLDKLVFGGQSLRAVKNWPWSISSLVKNLDQRIQDDKQKDFKSKATKFADGDATVEFVAPAAMDLPDTIKTARLAITKFMGQPTFVGSSGDFRMQADARPTSREAHVMLFQDGNRMKIMTELDEEDVWMILEKFDGIR
ncbi:MAG: hypothetical protein GY720_23195 [bacterium]|nr:hypothetical protein [bacterium]